LGRGSLFNNLSSGDTNESIVIGSECLSEDGLKKHIKDKTKLGLSLIELVQDYEKNCRKSQNKKPGQFEIKKLIKNVVNFVKNF